MLCPNCGADVGNEIKLCEKCETERAERLRQEQRAQGGTVEVGAEIDDETGEPTGAKTPGGITVTEQDRWGLLAAEEKYAHFFPRFVAGLIDFAAANMVVNLLWVLFIPNAAIPLIQAETAARAGFFSAIIAALKYFTFLVGAALPYFVLFNSTPIAATPGKMLLSLVVTSDSGGRLSVVDAILRELAKLVSAAIAGMGFLLILVSPKRQALHDTVSRSLVLEREELKDVRVILTLVFASFFFVGSFLLFHMMGAKIVVVPPPPPPAPVLEQPRDSIFRLGSEETRMPFSKSTWDRERNVIEVALSRTEGGLATPDVLILLRLRTHPPALTHCSQIGVSEFIYTLYRREGGLKLPMEKVSFSTGMNEENVIGTSMEELECELIENGIVVASLRGSRNILLSAENGGSSGQITPPAPGHEEEDSSVLKVVWEVHAQSALGDREIQKEFKITDADVATTVALLRRDQSSANPQVTAEGAAEGTAAEGDSAAGDWSLDIGFFSKDLSEAEREEIRSSQSLRTIDRKKPDVVLSLALKSGSTELSDKAVRTYGLIYLDGDKFILPTAEPELGFFYAGPSKLSDLSGKLEAGQVVQGKLSNQAQKGFEGTERSFIWDLSFRTTVIDPTATVTATTREDLTAPIDDGSPPTNTGRVTVEKSSAEFVSTLALLYPAANRLAVGFFAEPLTDGDKLEFKKRGTLSVAVNSKRPVMIIAFDFTPGNSEASINTLNGYGMYLQRSSFLVFPGMHDSISGKRLKEKLGQVQIGVLKGSLVAGGTLRLKAKGKEELGLRATPAEWEVSYDLPIVSVE